MSSDDKEIIARQFIKNLTNVQIKTVLLFHGIDFLKMILGVDELIGVDNRHTVMIIQKTCDVVQPAANHQNILLLLPRAGLCENRS